jgi:hypothetical protein
VLVKRRDVNEMGPPETLWWPEMDILELELSLDLGERDFVFSPPPGEVEVPGQEAELLEKPPAPLSGNLISCMKSGSSSLSWVFVHLDPSGRT